MSNINEDTFSFQDIHELHEDFQPMVASTLMKKLLDRIEKDKKDIHAIDAASELMSCKTIVLPAFSGEKRKEWIKQLKKAKKKAMKKIKNN